MTMPAPVSPLSIEDYDAIEAAVMETSRGRWFLNEYARRNRNSDTDLVLNKLERLERTIRRDRSVPDIDRIRLDLADMAEAITRTKQEIAQMKLDTAHGGRFADASQELDAIVSQTETATNEILMAAESIQEAAWTLREAGASDEICDKLDTQATDIYTACSFQDLTGQRTRKVVTVLRYLESRINAMMGIWGIEEEDHNEKATEVQTAPSAFDPNDTRPDAHLLNGPQLHGRGMGQHAVDDLMWHEEPVDIDAMQFDAIATDASDDTAEAMSADPTDEIEAAPAEAVPETLDAAAIVEGEVPTERPADVFAQADVFAPADSERIATPVAETETAFDDAAPTTMTVAVGNTLRSVEVAVGTESAVEAAPALAVVPVEDPIAALDPKARLVTFG